MNTFKNNRFLDSEYKQDRYWADSVADKILHLHPNKKVYRCAVGWSPSGYFHFGNCRDFITSAAVAIALSRRGKKVEILFSIDNLDAFLKVPSTAPKELVDCIGKPLSMVKDNKGNSYAKPYEDQLKECFKNFPIKIIWRDQSECYGSGVYDEKIILALKKRKEIADILWKNMTEKSKENKSLKYDEYTKGYYPIEVFSRFNQKNNTKVLSFDGERKITYKCLDTNKEDEIDITKDRGLVKLLWKSDWAMRWEHEDIVYEPAGLDHAAVNGSYDVSSEIVKKVFNFPSPVLVEYGFVGLQGLAGKMSGSKGNLITLSELLDIYEEKLLYWMYFKRMPKQQFNLSLGSEIYRQYDELDRIIKKEKFSLIKKLTEKWRKKDALYNARVDLKNVFKNEVYKNPISFRKIVGFSQVVAFKEDLLIDLLRRSGDVIDKKSIKNRMPKAKTFIKRYQKDEAIELEKTKNKEFYLSLSDRNKKYIEELVLYVKNEDIKNIKKLEEFLYKIPKKDSDESNLKTNQKEFFSVLYRLLIGKNRGPRLATFISAVGKDKILFLLA